MKCEISNVQHPTSKKENSGLKELTAKAAKKIYAKIAKRKK
jgi:hypothetical protein